MNLSSKLYRPLIIASFTMWASSLTATETPVTPKQLLPELAQILDAAKQNAPELVEEGFMRLEADQRLLQAKSDYYPSLDLGANLGVRRQYRSNDEDTSNFGLNYNARLTRPLYHWGAIEARIEQARIDNDTKALDYLQNTRLIFRQIRSDYLTLLLNSISLRIENIRKENLQSDLEKLKIDFENGKISELSYQGTQLNLQNSLLLIGKIKRDQKQIISRFRQTAGWQNPINSEMQIPKFEIDPLEKWLEEEAATQSKAWTQMHYSALLIENEINDQKEAMTIIKARQRPIINFTASATQDQSNTSTANNVDTLTLFAGLSVSWNIFDGFQTKHRKIEANLKKRRLESKLDRLKKELLQQQQQMIDAIYYQLKNTKILEKRYELEGKLYMNKQSDFKAGRLTQNDLRDSKLQLTNLELQLMTARADLLMSLSDYNDLTIPMVDRDIHK